ncbi:hypothetical protein [Blastomonas sp.]|uniref:hypothetical protein n=1 Tax=Blastomonas sp. TaxID=1909299 RepID=UPI0035946B79
MGFLRDISPLRALADIKTFWFDQQPHKWAFIGLSLLATSTIFFAFVSESGFEREWKRPEIMWVTSLDPGRSDAQIAEENRANQAVQDKILAEQIARDEERKAQYRRLAEQFGMDTE